MNKSTRHALTALGLLACLPASAQVVYFNDFDSPATVGAGVSATFTSPGALIGTVGSFTATYGNIHRSASNTTSVKLTLSGLPAHTALSLSFIGAFLDSWDGTSGAPAPDYLNLTVDGNLIGQYTSGQASGGQYFFGGGTQIAGPGTQFDANQSYSDVVVDFSTAPALSFAHSASSITIEWIAAGAGWQGVGDEYFGIDNVKVVLTPVPEPGTWALMALGLAGLGAAARRRKA
jgi:hypothetical protein